MKKITLLPVPNQALSFDRDGQRYDLRIFSVGGRMCYDLDIDGKRVLSSCRMVAGKPLIPFDYLSTKGNFAILTQNDDEPNYTKFGVTQVLIYGSANQPAQN